VSRIDFRARSTQLFVGAIVLAATVVLVVVLLPGRESATVKPPGGLGVATALVPRSLVFGQPVHARLDVLLDRRQVSPDSVQIRGAFTPYLVQGDESRIREDVGPLTRLRLDYTLTCLDIQCLPPDPTQAGQGTVRLPPLLVAYKLRSGKLETRIVTWPALIVSSRLALGDIAQLQTVNVPPFAASTTLPKSSYAIDPTLLRWLLAAAALVLLGGAAWLVRRALAPPAEPVAVEPVAVDPYEGMTQLERALVGVRRTLADADVPQRRRALEQLALALAAYNGGGYAATATALAWSEPPPTAATTRGLVHEVEQIVELERKRAARST
jgi:hypothetical protein